MNDDLFEDVVWYKLEVIRF